MDLREILAKKLLIGDGAMGTMLFKKGFTEVKVPESLNIEYPQVIAEIHEEYLESGAHFVETNTFGANKFKLQGSGWEDRIYELNYQAVVLAKKSVQKFSSRFVAGSLGPTGKLIYPEGEVTFQQVREAYMEQARALEDGGADFLILETFSSLRELKAALSGVKEAVKIPVFAQLTFFENGRSLSGATVEILAETVKVMGADGVGINCSLGPKELVPLLARLVLATDLPVSVMPNAGIPQLIGEETIYPLGPEEYLEEYLPLVETGVSVIGGCCGTDPEFISLLVKKFDGLTPKRKTPTRYFTLASGSMLVKGGLGEKVIFIGERINPTGRKKLAQDIKERKFELVVKSAKNQVQAGAVALDINVGLPGENEAELLPKAALSVSNFLHVPLSLDSNNSEAIVSALEVLDGKPLINSTSGKQEELERVLGIAKKYGASVIALLLDEEGIPEQSSRRITIAEKILKKAEEMKFPVENIIFDPLTMTIATGNTAALETLKTLEWLSKNGYYSILGLSNVSHGMPLRNIINSSFLAMATYAGMTAMIANPLDTIFKSVFDASNILVNRGNIRGFLSKYQGQKNLKLANNKETKKGTKIEKDGTKEPRKGTDIYTAVVEGNENIIEELLKKEIEKGTNPFVLVNEHLIPAIRKVGDLYDEGIYYLPQLIASARVMQKGFSYLKPYLKERGNARKKKFMLLTVEGDVHDIGKNIVGLLLENYGYEVIDLGKDVKLDDFKNALEEHQPDYVGLSALMTTTMPNMARFVKEVYNMGLKDKIIVFVGGACVTKQFAQDIGADYYGADGMELVKLLEKIENEKK